MLQQGRSKEALDPFRRATELAPEWVAPFHYLGVTNQRLGDHKEALSAFETALALDPHHKEALMGRGETLRAEGRFQEAIAAFDRVLQVDSAFAPAMIGKADALRMRGDLKDALVWFDHALQLDPTSFYALCGKGATLNSMERFSDAEPVWEAARKLKPDSEFVTEGLKVVRDGTRDGTVTLLKDILAAESSDMELPDDEEGRKHQEACDELDRGRAAHKDRDYAKASKHFEHALELDPQFAEAALRLGLAFEDDRQFRRAIGAYERCLAIEPDHFQAATNIGEAYRKNEEYADAIKAYDRALAMRPDYLYALAGRGECLRMLGRYDEALVWFDKALEGGPNHAFAIQGKAAALNALQRFEEAMPEWEKALDIEPQSQFALDGRAYCESQLRRTGAKEAAAPEPEASETPTLDEQGRDLSALAREGKLPEVVGRKKEIRQVMKTLVRRLKANPLLLGEPGVGKTAVVEGVARALNEEGAPRRLKDLRIIELSMGTLVAGTKYRGTFEERLREIIKEASSDSRIVLFIDEIHTLVGAGRTEGGSLDAANILKPALARGEITVIGATTHDEYRQHFESDSALDRRFQPIRVDEPSVDETVELLGRLAPRYEAHHEVTIEPATLRAAVELAVRYITDRRLPDKALDLLDEACAEASLGDTASVTPQTVATVVSERTGVPVTDLTSEEKERLLEVEEHLKERVIGQDAAVAHLANAVRLSRAGLRDPNRPRGVFLFRGGSGVGKTELAKALSDFLFPEGDALIRIDMSEYSEKIASSRLLGAPPGYVGHGEEGSLSGPLRRRPYSVVLLDEFEKAHPNVQASFLPVFDDGTLTDSEGRQINAREAFFILTTNAGAEHQNRGRMGFGGGGDDRNKAIELVRPYFRPELINRIDEVISFEDLDDDALGKIVELKLRALAERAAKSQVGLTWADGVVEHIVSSRPNTGFGARPALRAIDELVGEPLGELLLRDPEGENRAYTLVVQDGKIAIDRDVRRVPLARQS